MRHHFTAALGRRAFLARVMASILIAPIIFIIMLVLINFLAGATGTSGTQKIAYMIAFGCGLIAFSVLFSSAIAGRMKDLEISPCWTILFWVGFTPLIVLKNTDGTLMIGVGLPGLLLILATVALLSSLPTKQLKKANVTPASTYEE